jgi:hypothetical protein
MRLSDQAFPLLSKMPPSLYVIRHAQGEHNVNVQLLRHASLSVNASALNTAHRILTICGMHC